MPSSNDTEYRTRAQQLVHQLIEEQDQKYGVGSMTVSIYDTAWSSMVSKCIDGQDQWMSPESFDYLLRTQQHNGGWHLGSSTIDSILNTLAALLALCKHITNSHEVAQSLREDLFHRRNRAIYYLDEKLSQWDVATTVSPGFELLVPKHLELLAAEGIDFNFPGLQTLCEIREQSSSVHDVALLYSTVRSSVACYLEGFVGEIEFSQMSRHKISGSIMASPASTAAYLMNSSEWDDESEDYLRQVLNIGNAKGDGGVPSQYPTTVFELTQSLSVLLANGFDMKHLGLDHLEKSADFLESCLRIGDGTTGSAPYMESEADSTAKTISTLCQLGRAPNPQGLLIRFETQDCFKTYTHERNPSFRTNCLVLKALLDMIPGNSDQNSQIEKTVKFITNYWWTTNGEIQDSSNLSTNHPLMLIADAFTRLLQLWDRGMAPLSEDIPMREKIYICLYQVLIRTLQTQNPDGSWGREERCETTAYAILTLTKLTDLSSAPSVRTQLRQALEMGRGFLALNYAFDLESEHLWSGKIISGSRLVSQAYVVAALEASPTASIGDSVERCFDMSLGRLAVQTKYFARQPWFTNVSEWQIQACLVESQLFLPQLRAVQFATLPQKCLPQDQYFEIIPFMWLATNRFEKRLIAPEYLYQMMVITFLNRQIDDFIAHDIAEVFAGCMFEVEDTIHQIFEQMELVERTDCYCESFDPASSTSSSSTTATATIDELRTILSRFVTHILHHPYVKMASSRDQAQLRSELLSFLVSRIYKASEQSNESTIRQFFGPIDRCTDQTHHAYAFAFLECLVGNQRTHGDAGLRLDFLESPEQQYIAAALCRHISVVDFLTSNNPDQPVTHLQHSAKPHTSDDSGCSPRRLHSSSISSASTASLSSYSNGGVSPASITSSNSSAPGVSPLSDRFHRHQRNVGSQASNDSFQFVRLLSHEKRCLEVCIQDLEAAGISQRTANVIGLFADVSELSSLVFSDPSVGSYHRPPTVHQVTEQACDFSKVQRRPEKTACKGSVRRARGGLNIKSLQLKPISWIETTNFAIEGSNPSKETVPPSSAPPQVHEFNFIRPVPRCKTRRPSTLSIEMSRIENIMSEMGEGSGSPKNLPNPTAHEVMPRPKINPMLINQQIRTRAATAIESIYTLAPRNDRENLKRFNSTPSLGSGDPNAAKLAKARFQTQRKICEELDKQLEKDRKVREKEERRDQHKRADSLQTRAMVEAAKPVLAAVNPIPTKKVKKSSMQKVRFQDEEKQKRKLAEQGWVKAPAAEKKCGSFMDFGLDGCETGKGKLRRARKMVGPKLKLPF